MHIGVAVDQGADVECGDGGLRVLAEEVGGNALLVVVLEEVEHVTADLGVGIGGQRKTSFDGIDGTTTFDHAADGIVELDLVIEVVETTCDDVVLIDTWIVDLGNEEHVGILLLDAADAVVPEFVGHHFGHVATEGIDALGAPVEQDVAHLDPSGGDGDGAIGILPRLDACAVGLVIHAVVEFDGLVPVVGRWGDCAEDVVACDFGWFLDVGIGILGVFLGLGALILHLVPDERLTGEVIEVVVEVESLVGLVACTQILDALGTGDGVILAGHMVGHKVHHDLETGVVAALDKRFEFLGASVDIVGDVGTDGIIVADGVGRACIALDDSSRLARQTVLAPVGLGGLLEDAGVPDVVAAQATDTLKSFGRDVTHTPASVLLARTIIYISSIVVAEDADHHLINDDLALRRISIGSRCGFCCTTCASQCC